MAKRNLRKEKQKARREKAQISAMLKGKLDISRSGMGFVIVENLEEDIMVRPDDFNRALHGDTVRVKITGTKGKRQRGVVVDIIKRKQTEFAGRIQLNKNFAFFISDSEKPMPDMFVPFSNLKKAKDGDRVIAKILSWEKRDKRPIAEIVAILTEEEESNIAMKEILLQYGFSLSFPEEALKEAEKISDHISQKEIEKRKDVRDVLTFTIDPVDAKDFDDAISFQILKNGNYEIGVHIADVSHYLEIDSELDKAAFDKATSVYLPDRVSPMLPEHISNVLCSLRPKEDKLTFSTIFQLTPSGEIKEYWLGKTIIHSNHRFTYEEVQEIIETKEGLFKKEILILNKIAQEMRRQRIERGAINFSSQEVKFKLDEKGKPIGVMIKESKEAHQLIEEFMLLANRSVAEHLSKVKINAKQIPVPFRIHDNPDKEKLLPFVSFANKYGYKFDTSSPKAISISFNQMLRTINGKPEQHVLEQLGIRTMAKAKYTSENVGHYGLGFEHYCHFTSPIRRYPDVMVHRILEQTINKGFCVDKKMEEKCKHCSERERSAMEAERAGNKYKQVEYMQNFIGEEFEGIISGVSSFGFWVETVEHKCEGLVSIISLSEVDDFRHVVSDYCLTGMRTGRSFRMGDKIWIKVVSANLSKRQMDYEWVITSGLKVVKTEKVKSKKK